MTISSITWPIRFEDWSRDLITLSDLTTVILDRQDIISEKGTVVKGATRHKLEQAEIVAPSEVEGTASVISAAMSWSGWQAIRWVPHQDSDHEIWGIIVKQSWAYETNVGNNRITLRPLLDPGHIFFHARIVGGEGTALSGNGIAADDFAKDLVNAAFSGTTPGGRSRAWGFGGTLSIAADNTECSVLSDEEAFDGYLDQVLDALAEKYNFLWELKPSISGGALTWTFETKANYLTDRTSGANRVVIDGFAGSAPKGERYLDRVNMVNEWITKDRSTSVADTTSQTTWGLWEGITQSTTLDDIRIDLANSLEKEGSVWTYEPSVLRVYWMVDFEVGDQVVKANSRTNEAESNAVIEAISWEWPDRVLKTTIRWGDKKPTKTAKDKSGGGGGGGAGSGHDVAPQISLVADDSNKASPDELGQITVAGGAHIATTAGGDTLTVALDDYGWDATGGNIVVETNANGYAMVNRLYLASTSNYVRASGSVAQIGGGTYVNVDIGGSAIVTVSSTAMYAQSAATLGLASNYWGNAYLGSYVYVGNGNVYIRNASNAMYLGSSSGFRLYHGAAYLLVTSTQVRMSNDKTADLGGASYRFATMYGDILNVSGSTHTIRGLAYVWPSTHALGAIKNDGSGTLSFDRGYHRHQASNLCTNFATSSFYSHATEKIDTGGMIDIGGGDHKHQFPAHWHTIDSADYTDYAYAF